MSQSDTAPTMGKPLRLHLRNNGGVLALIMILLVNAVFTPNFLQLQTLFVNISQVATIAIVAMGMTLVIATGGIDLSVGAVMALAGALAPLIFKSQFGIDYPALIRRIVGLGLRYRAQWQTQ